MSKPSDEDDEEESECFYESLDRLVSSSSCSCSASNSDYDYDSEPTNSDSSPQISSHDHPSADTTRSSSRRRRRRNPFPVPRFPMGASGFDVWTSEPASVPERRSRLLHEMDLSRDPALLRLNPVAADLSSTGDFVGSSDFPRLAS